MYKLKVTPNQAMSQIKVFDGDNNLVANEEDALDIVLPKGIYKVRTEFNGKMHEENIRHANDQIIHPDFQYDTSIPLFGAQSSHEYYSYPAMEQSELETTQIDQKIVEESDSSIYLFARAEDEESYKQMNKPFLLDGFELLDENLNSLLILNSTNCKQDNQFGWAALNVRLNAGQYYLKYSRERNRTFPIYVVKNWRTQIFLKSTGVPLLKSIRLFMTKNRLDMDDQILLKSDVAINNLQKGILRLPKTVKDELDSVDFNSPILGLIALYLIPRNEIKENLEWIMKVINKIDKLFDGLYHPDLAILKLHFSKYSDFKDSSVFSFAHPPMFRKGFEILENAAIKDENLITNDSVISEIAIKQQFDNYLTCWREEIIKDTAAGLIFNQLIPQRKKRKNIENVIADLQNWVIPAVVDSVNASQNKGEEPTINSISRDLGIPSKTVKEKIQQLPILKNNPGFLDSISNRFLGLNVTKDSNLIKIAESIQKLKGDM